MMRLKPSSRSMLDDPLRPFRRVMEEVHLEPESRMILGERGQLRTRQGCDIAVHRHDRVGGQSQHRRSRRDGLFRERVGPLPEQVVECLASAVGDQPGFRHDSAVQTLDQTMTKPEGAGPGVCVGDSVHEIKRTPWGSILQEVHPSS